MELSIERDPQDPRRFRVAGEVDISNHERLVEALAGPVEEGGDLVLDLSGLEFMDSQGIRALLILSQRLEGRGRLKLVSPGSVVSRLLEVVRADAFPNVEVVRDGDEA
ncbi:MAG TPA: STAS domain-containing protein [Actinomycetota bacterium]|nr:STAS domain-containing protein [Actinomycetota bacterium]